MQIVFSISYSKILSPCSSPIFTLQLSYINSEAATNLQFLYQNNSFVNFEMLPGKHLISQNCRANVCNTVSILLHHGYAFIFPEFFGTAILQNTIEQLLLHLVNYLKAYAQHHLNDQKIYLYFFLVVLETETGNWK